MAEKSTKNLNMKKIKIITIPILDYKAEKMSKPKITTYKGNKALNKIKKRRRIFKKKIIVGRRLQQVKITIERRLQQGENYNREKIIKKKKTNI